MSEETIIIKANKFHTDTGFKFFDYSEKSIQLINKDNVSKFLPKSKMNYFNLGGGVVEIHVEKWLLSTKENAHFFKSVL